MRLKEYLKIHSHENLLKEYRDSLSSINVVTSQFYPHIFSPKIS
ncbi:hypothetical protein [Chinese giant salamander iridovirus]|uniref:Uncharacterized protein n=1 Tax=Chinese giant salamander iridovirus TaxID=1213990 RepID=V5N023_FRG3V|nr:hypothetical protein [Chinese giant salamander iridovirus]